MNWVDIAGIVLGALFIWRWRGFAGKVCRVTWSVIEGMKADPQLGEFAKALAGQIAMKLRAEGLESAGESINATVDPKPERKSKWRRFVTGCKTFSKTVLPFIT